MEEMTLLLGQAAAEIRGLRQQNQLMNARLEMFDAMMLLFTSKPEYRGQGMSPDIVYQIEKLLQKPQ